MVCIKFFECRFTDSFVPLLFVFSIAAFNSSLILNLAIINTNKRGTKESATFKKRCANHKKSFNLINSKNDTTLSVEYWTLKQKQQPSRFTWEIKRQYKAYNSFLKKCNLCLNGKLMIIDDPDKNLLNKRSEVISSMSPPKQV